MFRPTMDDLATNLFGIVHFYAFLTVITLYLIVHLVICSSVVLEA